ncbi:uncharacterized protein LOC125232681 [Leguminivora glycinivorella]|uniref:uncharacterized protein LOC125232681 n=1 Tax=Leguminivora glycinivorella TaxID=1035111 RepID=UPI00200BD350|nr:uncharacterized protein LOC125232681 [Leguminivora glycinivorella]
MKMLRWAGGVTRLDKVRNEYVTGSFRVAPIVEKVMESRLRWYGHIQRREDDYVVSTQHTKLDQEKRKAACHLVKQHQERDGPGQPKYSDNPETSSLAQVYRET